MKQKLTILSLLAAIGGLGVYSARPLLSEPSEVTINAPAVCQIGELVRLDTEGSLASAFSWKVLPETPNFQTIDGGRAAVFSSGALGQYTFIVSGVYNDTVCIETHTITVGGTADIESKIRNWPRPDVRVNELGEAFLELAEQSMLPEEYILATQHATKQALGDQIDEWQPFLQHLREELNQLARAGELRTVEDHQRLWKRIGDALCQIAETS